MTKDEARQLKELIDGLISDETLEAPTTPTPERKLPEGQRVVRTKSSGDKVYLLDDTKKTRAWITNGDVLTALGFTQMDVTEIDDVDLFKYQMSLAIYKVPDAA